MGARFDKRDSHWLLGNIPLHLNEDEKLLVETAFETEVNFEEKRIATETAGINFLKRVCLVKVLLFIPEYVLLFIFFNKKYRLEKIKATAIFYKFLRNKITYTEFQKEVHFLSRSGLLT